VSWIVGLGWFLAGCGGSHPHSADPTSTRVAPPITADRHVPDLPAERAENQATTGEEIRPGPFRFADLLPESGVDFVHVSGMTPDKQFPTANGSGVAILDFDNDGKLDLYFATGNRLPLDPSRSVPNRLYKNLGGGRFRDATERSGLGFRG